MTKSERVQALIDNLLQLHVELVLISILGQMADAIAYGRREL